MLQLAASSGGRPFAQAALHAQSEAAETLLAITLPIAVFTVFTAILAGIVATLGPVFAFDPITPKMEHINPAAGLKRMFSLKSVVEFGKNLFKIVMLGAALFLVMRGWLQTMFEIPACGEHCITPVFMAMLKALGAIAAIAFILVGFADLLLQRALFLRDMRMTRTEYKRERKDLEGDPIIRSEQRRRRTMAHEMPSKLGLRNAVCMIITPGFTVGLRFHESDSPVPTVVSKAQGDAAARMEADARALGIPVVEHAELAKKLSQLGVGDMIARQHFTEVAGILVRVGVI